MWIEGTEVPARGDRIRETLDEAGASFVDPRGYDDAPFEAVHDPALLSFLANAYDEWVAGGYLDEPGQDRVVPYVFPLPQLTSGRAPRRPTAASARTGMFAMDTMTLIGPGTWEAARAVAEAALTAADLVADGITCRIRRLPATGTPRRPRLLRRVVLPEQRCHRRTATALPRHTEGWHHRPRCPPRQRHPGDLLPAADVVYGSVHVDPGAGWFPHFVGYGDETGDEEGVGANLNLPMPPGTGDSVWIEAVDRLTRFVAERDIGAMVVSLGVDAARDDPESPLQVTVDGYMEAGRQVAGLGLPTVFVQEGGYHLDSLGQFVLATLLAFEGEKRERHD